MNHLLITEVARLPERGNPLLDLVIIAFGIAIWVQGVKTWRGEEHPAVIAHQRTHGAMTVPNIMGGRRLYQTPLGVGHIGVPGGIGLVVVGTTEFLRLLLHLPREHWLVYLLMSPGVVLVTLAGLYALVYFWIGVPDWLRPPAQRGWRIGKDGYELIRPEAVPAREPEPEWPPPGWFSETDGEGDATR